MYLQQGQSCGWNLAPDLCRDSKWWVAPSLWARCLVWLCAVLTHCVQLSSMLSYCCHAWMHRWHLCSCNSALSLTVWKADAVNTFPDGGTEEAYIFLFCKVRLPKINCSVLSCCSFTTSVSENALRTKKSVLYNVRQIFSLPAWIPACFCHTGKKCQKAAFVLRCLKKFLSNQGRAQGEGIGKILLPVFVLNFLVSGRSRLVRKQYADFLGDMIPGWWLN